MIQLQLIGLQRLKQRFTLITFLMLVLGVIAPAAAQDPSNDKLDASTEATSTEINSTEIISTEVNTIVALSPHSVEMLFEVGLGDKIAATVDYADYPEAAKGIRRIGHSDFIDMEALLLLKPDLVVLSFEDTSPALVEQLKRLNFPLFDTSVGMLDDIATRLAGLGEVAGNKALAQEKAQAFRAQLTSLRQIYGGRTPVKVFYQIWPEPLTTVSGGWMNGILTDCGGENIFANGVAAYPQVSMEKVLIRSPELILKPHYHGNSNQEAIDWGQWPTLPATKNDQIRLIQGDLVHRTGPRVVKGMAKVCEIIDQARKAKSSGAVHD